MSRNFHEIAECARNFEHFLHYVKLEEAFELQDFHKRYIRHLEANRFTIATKFRNSGLATLTLTYLLWKLVFVTNRRCLVLSPLGMATQRAKQFEEALNSLPEWLQPQLELDSLIHKRVLGTGTEITFRHFGDPEVKGMRNDYVFLEGAAFFSNMEEGWLSLFPVLAHDGRCIVLSMAGSQKGWFYDTYQSALEGTNLFRPFESKYTEHSGMTTEYIDEIRLTLEEDVFKQEIEQEFLPVTTDPLELPDLTDLS